VGTTWTPLLPLIATAVLLVWFYVQMGLMFAMCQPKESSFSLKRGSLVFMVVCCKHRGIDYVLTGDTGAVADHVPVRGAHDLAAHLLDHWRLWALSAPFPRLLRHLVVDQLTAVRG
jgi:hypothetical protein